MSTPYESLAQLARERVARLTVAAHDARLVGAVAAVECPTPAEVDRAAGPLPNAAAAPIRRLLPIRLP